MLSIKNTYQSYHAHVYFDQESQNNAKRLCLAAKEKFGLKIGRFNEKLVGPHPCWSCQITVEAKDFELVFPWLDQNREEMTIFIHAVTGDNMRDHTELTDWLGEALPLNLDFFVKLEQERASNKF
ncbi:DOPA 4,5-dioxygenase family protein [Vibrio sp. WJH972]